MKESCRMGSVLEWAAGNRFKLRGYIYIVLDIDDDGNLLCMLIDKHYTDNKWITSLRRQFNRRPDNNYYHSDIRKDLEAIACNLYHDTEYLHPMELDLTSANDDSSYNCNNSTVDVKILSLHEFSRYKNILKYQRLDSFWTLTPLRCNDRNSYRVKYVNNNNYIDDIDVNSQIWTYPVFLLDPSIDQDDTFEVIQYAQSVVDHKLIIQEATVSEQTAIIHEFNE